MVDATMCLESRKRGLEGIRKSNKNSLRGIGFNLQNRFDSSTHENMGMYAGT